MSSRPGSSSDGAQPSTQTTGNGSMRTGSRSGPSQPPSSTTRPARTVTPVDAVAGILAAAGGSGQGGGARSSVSGDRAAPDPETASQSAPDPASRPRGRGDRGDRGDDRQQERDEDRAEKPQSGPLSGESLEGVEDTGADGENDQAGADEGGGDLPDGFTLKDLAERLELDPEKLYSAKVITGDGEAISLGELKDAWADRQKAARETARREAGLDERETAFARDRALYAQLARDLQAQVDPGTIERLRERNQEHEARERRLMVETMPELGDRSTFESWRGEVVDMLGEYGYRPAEMAITDHRMLRVLRDHMRLRARMDELLAFEPEAKPAKATRPQGRGDRRGSRSEQLAKRARETGRREDQVAAISSLIDG